MSEDPFAKPRVVVVQRLTGFKAVARRDEDGNLVLEGVHGGWMPMLDPGEKLRVQNAVDDDATYSLDAQVVEAKAGRRVIQLDPEQPPTREQQRRFARVVTPELGIDLTSSATREAVTGSMLNLSAGGARAEADLEGLTPGSRIDVVFDLPGRKGEVEHYDLDGEVAWSGHTRSGRPLLGIRFLDADEPTEARLAGWVLRAQARANGSGNGLRPA